jgi:hypothetical protein
MAMVEAWLIRDALLVVPKNRGAAQVFRQGAT